MFGIPVQFAALVGIVFIGCVFVWVFAFFINLKDFGGLSALKTATLWALLFAVIVGGGIYLTLVQHHLV